MDLPHGPSFAREAAYQDSLSDDALQTGHCKTFLGYNMYNAFMDHGASKSWCRGKEVPATKAMCFGPNVERHLGKHCLLADARVGPGGTLELGGCDLDKNMASAGRPLKEQGLPALLRATRLSGNREEHGTNCKVWVEKPAILVLPGNSRSNGNFFHENAQMTAIFLARRMAGMVDDDTDAVALIVGSMAYRDKWGIYGAFTNEPPRPLKDVNPKPVMPLLGRL